MPNLVQSNGNAVGAYTGGANPWAEAARGVESGAYLKFNGNDGRYSFGQDDEDLPEKSHVIADMESFGLGWMCWVDSNVEEEIIVPVVEGKPPLEHQLTDHGPYNEDDGWRSAASISLGIDSYGGDDRHETVGTRLLWKTSTGGQVRSLQKLSGAYGRVFNQHPDEYPIVELGVESYAPKNKKHGKIKYSPSLKIVGWIPAAELEALVGASDSADDYEPEEPVAKTRREPEPEPEVVEEPRRGRRAPEPEPEADEPPARGRRQAAPADDQQDEPPARGRRAAVAEEPAEEPRRGRRQPEPEPDADEPPARGSRRAAPEPEQGDDEDEPAAPAPRGRSPGRGAPPEGNARLRRF